MMNVSTQQWGHGVREVHALPPSPRVAVIRQELVEITGNSFSAVILNQLLYWTQRVKDFDLLLEEERNFNPDRDVLPRHGWIYKTAHELSEETLLKISHPTMRKYLKLLTDQGLIEERAHPIDKWNKTTQYRVNLRNLSSALHALGYPIPGAYRDIFVGCFTEDSEVLEDLSEGAQTSNVTFLQLDKNVSKEFLQPDVKDFVLEVRNVPSDVKNLHSYPYTESTSKTTNKEHTERARFDKNFLEGALKVWSHHVGQEIHFTETRKAQLKNTLSRYFDSDLEQWKRFCERIKASPFLMGRGPRRWHVTLDWILLPSNLLKVLEGNFDPPSVVEENTAKRSQEEKNAEIQAILASIADPLWKKWCTQLASPHSHKHVLPREDSLSLSALKELAGAWFDHDEGRLIWIASDNQQSLDRAEALQFRLLSVVQKDLPQAGRIRTHLKPHSPIMTGEHTHE